MDRVTIRPRTAWSGRSPGVMIAAEMGCTTDRAQQPPIEGSPTLGWEYLAAFRRKMSEGKVCLGPTITYTDPAVSETLGGSADFLWIDLEHSPIGIESLQGHLMAADVARTPALVRVPSAEVATIKRVLDTGAEAIIVPQIETVTEVQAVVAASRYAPRGRRGYGPRRGRDYGRLDNAQYLQQSTEGVFVAVQIETAAALSALDDIVRIEGVDSLVIGPQDLAASLGHIGQPNHPEVLEAVRRIVRTGRGAGQFIGVGVSPQTEDILQYARLGAHWIMAGCDFHYLVAFAEQLYRAVARGLEA